MSTLIATPCSRLIPLPLSSSAPLFLAPLRLALPRIFRAQTFQPRSQRNNFHFGSYRRQLVNANYRSSVAKKRHCTPLSVPELRRYNSFLSQAFDHLPATTAFTMAKDPNNVIEKVRQSPPVDTTEPYDPAWVAGKTIVITGGASGFGAGFAKKWALNGANVFVADVNRAQGQALVEEMRRESGSTHHHFVYCDVTNWQSQVDLFKAAIKLSPHGGIDAVVANAGIADTGSVVDEPKGLDAEEPPKPVFKTIDVNVIGVLYTTHLAMFWLPRNDKTTNPSPSKLGPGPYTRDRHLLLIGSIASLCPIPHELQYGTSKHAVLGLFRSLRCSSFMHGVRVNMLCPYFIDTPIIPAGGRFLLAGGAMGKPEDVIDAGTRLMADSRISGRALAIGPKVTINEEYQLVPKGTAGSKTLAVWEAYADDFEEVDAFTRRLVGILNSVERTRGWIGWGVDIGKAALYRLGLFK